MPLYIANCSKFNYELHYWVENSKKPVVTKIRPGGQENVYPQGTREDHIRIVEQHKMYGLIPVSEIDRSKEFIGQCYQFDTPITHDRLFTTMERNDDVLYEQALERRKEAMASTDDLVRRAAQETDWNVGNIEVEIKEVEQKGVEPQIHEVIKIGEDDNQPRRRGRPRKS
ncbi:hypothetical protein [Burkholderia sp. BCC0405]|uniref:hypothetical protein n=1 Tax=Burkholderia sp. BCC0405 TaxID=2676298 RepID=UPI00158CC7F1|nr:hypothetical protein [Burkholderia sp. BCC0405]